MLIDVLIISPVIYAGPAEGTVILPEKHGIITDSVLKISNVVQILGFGEALVLKIYINYLSILSYFMQCYIKLIGIYIYIMQSPLIRMIFV